MGLTTVTSWCHGSDHSYQLVSWVWPQLPVGVMGCSAICL